MVKQSTPNETNQVIGRFAPSPTGHLHFGSLLTAIASYCQAKSQISNQKAGLWFLRIEDTDHQRCKPEYSDSILKTLETYGLEWDGEVLYQSKRLGFYSDVIDDFYKRDHVYGCQCSRKYLSTHSNNSIIYPKFCINKSLQLENNNVRIKLPNTDINFNDLVKANMSINPQKTLGDMIVKRRDGIFNYILTSILDDIDQGVTEVIRGSDLVQLTPCQIHITKLLNQSKRLSYGHLPLAFNQHGQKLSKQTKAAAIDTNNIPITINKVLVALNQKPAEVDSPANMLAQAINNWDISKIASSNQLSGIYL